MNRDFCSCFSKDKSKRNKDWWNISTYYRLSKSMIQVNLVQHCINKTEMWKAQLRCFMLPSACSSGDPFSKQTKSALDKTLAFKCQVEGIWLRWSDSKAKMKTCNRFPMCQMKLLKKTLIYCSAWSLQGKKKRFVIKTALFVFPHLTVRTVEC